MVLRVGAVGPGSWSLREPGVATYRPGAMRLRTSICLIAALAVVGCAGSGANPVASSPSASSPASAGLDGRTFLSAKVQGHDLVTGSTVRLTFKVGRVGINAGCNQMSGTYDLVDDHLRTGQMMTTEMGCDPPLMAQDTWVGSFIDGATVTLAGDTLTLGHGDVTMTLTDRVVADPDRPLEGTRWVLDGIVAGGAVSSVPAGVTAALTIANGRMQVETGCNTGGATVALNATTLTIGPMALTGRACASDTASVEAAMTAVLSGQITYAIAADVLTLSAGQAGLTLRAAS
jgi:heat shock protein HslJ